MTISPDDDFAAAEYALGTLDASERATLAASGCASPNLDEAIQSWEARLAPLAEATPEIEAARKPSCLRSGGRAFGAHRATRHGVGRLSTLSAASRRWRQWRSPRRCSPACWRSELSPRDEQAIRSA